MMLKGFRVTLCLFIILGLTKAFPQEKKEVKESCVTSKCHASMGKAKFVHGPVAVSDCSPCHQPLSNEKHKFKPIKSSGELCNGCHAPIEKKAVMHEPVLKGQCTACHDPHQSDQQYQLKKAPTSQVCFTCHKKEMVERQSVHGPVAEGECMMCHAPHASENPKLLLKAGNDLCFQCHADIKERFATAKNLHKPVERCTQCHNPHSNDAQFLLAKKVPEQCFTCHKDIQEHTTASLVKHKALDQDKSCLNCHSPHEAGYAKQLKDEPMRMCLSCHDKAMKSESAGTIANMKELFEKNKDWHGPVREKDCSGCHEVHGGQYFRMLLQNYPKEFYAPFSQDQYSLCFNCHQPTLVQDPTTTTLTGFRDGDRNLHYLHVNKKVKGRTCRACHETHASQHPKHIREGVPFGQWLLPIRFQKTATGGTCTPGCHATKTYSTAAETAAKKIK